MSNIEVRIGQLWRDMDTRMNGRTLRVTGFVLDVNGNNYQAICRVGAGHERYTKIRVNRFRPGSRGYRLVRDENGKRVEQ